MRFFSRNYALVALALSAVPVLTGCVDDSYDLENIDETIRVEVKDLTIPLNLKPVEFSSVIDLTDEECVEVNDNGEYVIVQSGTFEQTINIPEISAKPELHDNGLRVHGFQIPAVKQDISIPIPAIEDYKFDYDATADKAIKSIKSADVDFEISLVVNVSGSVTKVIDCSINDMKFSLPEGFLGWYDTNNGRVDITSTSNHEAIFPGETHPDSKGDIRFTYHVTEIDANKAGIHLDPATNAFSYVGSVGIEGCELNIPAEATEQSQAAEMSMRLELGDRIVVTSFTGEVEYNLNEIEQQHVDLNNMPDVLTDPNTNIVLNNPQIYIELNNPMARYGFEVKSGLQIRQVRNGEHENRAWLNGELTIDPTADGVQKFMFIPDNVTVDPIAGFEGAKQYKLVDLGSILAGEGLPKGLNIDFRNPRLPRKLVTMELKNDLGLLQGSYKFYAPLSFASGTQVIYTEDQHGWDIGGEEDFEISTLSISAHMLSDLPVAVKLIAYPLDVDGNVIKDNGEDVVVEVEPATIPAKADEDITISLKGKIRGLDGIRYSVTLAAGSDASALRPDMNLSLTNIRAKVSGYYESKDDNK